MQNFFCLPHIKNKYSDLIRSKQAQKSVIALDDFQDS